MSLSEISWKEEKQLPYSCWKQFVNLITGVPERIHLSKYFLSHAEYFIASRPQNKIYLSIRRYSYSRPLFQDGLGILCPVKIVLILRIIMVHISKEKKLMFFRIGKEESFKYIYIKKLLRIWIYPIVTCKFFNHEWTNHHFAILSVLAQWSHLWAL